ncbi:MAG: ATP-binding protein [Pseudomonadota bacterium]
MAILTATGVAAGRARGVRLWAACVLGAVLAGAAPGVAAAAGGPDSQAGASSGLSGPPAVADLKHKRILFLTPYSFGRPGLDAVTRNYIEAMVRGGVSAENVQVEFLNLNRNLDPEVRRRHSELLRLQYEGQHFDLIVALQEPSLRYALTELAGLAPGVPVLSDAVAVLEPALLRDHPVAFQRMPPDLNGTMEQILKLMPRTGRVVITTGVAGADQAFKREAQAALAPWRSRVAIEFTDDRSFADTLAYLRTLGPGTVVVTGATNRDVSGVAVSHTEYALDVARASRVPVFALYDTLLPGSGMLGGSVRHLGREAGRLAGHSLEILRGSLRLERPVTELPSEPVLMYDWRQLQRWQIDPALVGPQAIFVNRPLSLWQQYRDTVLLTAGVFLLLTAMLGVLLVQRRRLERSEQRSRESEERFRVLVEHAPEAIMVYDLDLWRFVDVNRKAERLFACARARLLQLGPLELYPLEQFEGMTPQQAIQDNGERAFQGQDLLFERIVRDTRGRTFPCEVSLTRLPASGRRLVRIAYADISERKRAQQELLQHRNHLEELVQQRTAALSVALSDAQAANRAKSVFLANMSHELRTPLNSVIGFSQMLADSASMRDDEKRHLAIINRSGHHLLNLINDILELSKIEAGRVQLQESPLELTPLLHEVLEMVRVRSEQAGVALLLDCGALPARVGADGAKLRQVLLNLLSNAVKFVERGSITLALHAHVLDEERVELAFAVRDTGIGIALADQQRIFEPFVQAGATTTAGGTGLGLAISREFVRLMGGELQVQSQPGTGSSFTFTVVARRQPAGAPAAGAGRVSGLPLAEQGKTILVVDDQGDCRELLRSLLAPLGFCVSDARDGAAAAVAIAAAQPDLVLMDWRMPVMDGLELTRWVRAQPGLRQPRIVMLTASAFEEERRQALAAGADDFLRKPIEQDKLYAILARQLDLHFIAREQLAPGAQLPAPALTRADLAALAPAERAALMLAVRELDVKRAAQILAGIEAAQPRLAEAIGAMLERHQYLPLWELLQAAPALAVQP